MLSVVPCAYADVSVEWTGPADCGDGAVVEAEVARLLAADADSAVHAVVSVTHAETWSAVVLLSDGETVLGERTFEAGSCEELRGAVALLIVLAVDPDAVLAMPLAEGGTENGTENQSGENQASEPVVEYPTPPPGQTAEDAADLGEPRQEPAAAEPGQEEPLREEPGQEEPGQEEPGQEPTASPDRIDAHESGTRRARERIEAAHWGVAVRGGVDFGALPAPSPVFSVGVFHQRRRFALGLYALTVLPQDASTSVAASGRLAMGALRATPGLHLRYGRLMLDLRGVVELGVMAGRGRDVAGPQTGYSLWAALGVEAGLSVRIGPISLGFRGDIRVPLNRPLYAFRGPLDVHRAASLVGRAEIALGLHFL